MKDRILFISSIFPNRFNQSAGIYNLHQLTALSDHFEIDVVSPISVFKIFNFKGMVKQKFWNFSVQYPRLYHVPGYFHSLNGYFYLFSIWKTCSRLIHKHEYKAIYSTWLFPDCWAASELARRYKLPLITKVHGSDVNCLDPATYAGEKGLEAASRSYKTLCVSQALKEKLTIFGVHPDKLQLLYNGVDTSCFYPTDRASARQQLGLGHQRKILIYVGNIKESKGVFDLIEVYSEAVTGDERYAEVDLVYVGGGGDLPRLKSAVRDDGLESRVTFIPPLLPDDIALWMNASDLLCLPSHMEGVPNVVLEALCCDLPVVATAVGGIPEIANLDDRVLLAPMGDRAMLLNQMEKVLFAPIPSSRRAKFCSWAENASIISAHLDNLEHAS